MYLVEDRLSPAISDYVNNLKAKNTVLNYWPKEMDGADEVFGIITYYNGSIVQSADYLKLYHLLNIKVEDLEAESYEGVDSAWIYLKRVVASYEITVGEIGNYIDFVIPLTVDTSVPVDSIPDASGVFNFSLNYNPATLTIPEGTTDAELIAMCREGHPDIWFGNEDEERAIALAIIDVDDIMFEKTFTVTSRTIEPKTIKQLTLANTYVSTTSNYVATANINLRLRRVKGTNDPLVADILLAIQARTTAIDDYAGYTATTASSSVLTDTTALEISRFSAMNTQLLIMYELMVDVVEGQLNSASGKIKVEGFRALSAKDASQLLRDQLSTDFKKEKVSFWKKALNIIIQIVTLIIAIIIAIPSGGSSLAAWAAWAGTVSLVLMVGMATQMALAMYYQSTGDVNAASMVGGSMKFLGTISTVIGIIGLFASIGSAAAKIAAKEAAKEAGKEAVKETIKTGIVEELKSLTMDNVISAVKNMVIGGVKSSTTKVLQSTLKVLTMGLDMYREYIDPLPKEITEMEEEIAAQERELEDYSSADTPRKIFMMVDSPYANIYDMNEYMHNIPYQMTEGKNVALMTKYYS